MPSDDAAAPAGVIAAGKHALRMGGGRAASELAQARGISDASGTRYVRREWTEKEKGEDRQRINRLLRLRAGSYPPARARVLNTSSGREASQRCRGELARKSERSPKAARPTSGGNAASHSTLLMWYNTHTQPMQSRNVAPHPPPSSPDPLGPVDGTAARSVASNGHRCAPQRLAHRTIRKRARARVSSGRWAVGGLQARRRAEGTASGRSCDPKCGRSGARAGGR